MRIKLDEKYLNSIKIKLINKLNLNREIIDRINKSSSALYVENLQETQKFLMQCRRNEIVIDKKFIQFDNFGNVLGYKNEYLKFIESQLGHELIHAASSSENYSGINGLDGRDNRGLNEGITQMYTEDVFGYVVSRFTDAYGDYKKIAKIMRLCVGDDPVRRSYFNHTNELKKACNKLASNDNFFDQINKSLTDLYYLRHESKGKSDEIQQMSKNIYSQRIKSCYESIIINMVIPKIKQMKSKEEINKFLTTLLKSISDDEEIMRKVIDILKEKIKLTEQQLNEEKNKVRLNSINGTYKHLIFHLISTNNISKSEIIIDNSGKISYKNKNNQCIEIEEDEELYSYIYNYLFSTYLNFNDFQMEMFIDYLQKNNEINFDAWNQRKRRIFFCRLKKVANKKGLEILNSYHEVDQNKIVKVNFINKNINFEDLKQLIERYELKLRNKEDIMGEYIVVDRVTNKIIKNQELETNVKFAYLWLSTNKVRWTNEQIPGITTAFNQDNKKLYEELLNIMVDNVRKTGNIDLNEMYRYAEKHYHSRMEKIVETILKNPLSYEITYSFIKQKTGKSTTQTEKEKSYVEKSNDRYQQSIIDLSVEEIVTQMKRR